MQGSNLLNHSQGVCVQACRDRQGGRYLLCVLSLKDAWSSLGNARIDTSHSGLSLLDMKFFDSRVIRELPLGHLANSLYRVTEQSRFAVYASSGRPIGGPLSDVCTGIQLSLFVGWMLKTYLISYLDGPFDSLGLHHTCAFRFRSSYQATDSALCSTYSYYVGSEGQSVYSELALGPLSWAHPSLFLK